jgi:hypothetical protein
VEAVKDAVDDRGEEDAAAGDEDEAAEEGVQGGEDFGGGGLEVGAEDGALAAHEHGGFEEGIEPVEATDEPITEDAECQGKGDQGEGDEEVIGQAPEEDGVRGDGLVVVLEGHGLFVHKPKRKTKRQERAEPKISEKVGKVLGSRIWDIG